MINPHLQTGRWAVGVFHQQATEETALHAIAELQNFIDVHPDAREVRKALAVKLVYQGYLYDEIQTILDVSRGSITGWKQAYEENGIDGLRLNYQGRKSYLLSEQREEVLSWLQTKDTWELGELEYKLAFDYDVVYESKQSYYALFEEAGISWKKTTKLNPKANPDVVAEKKKRLKHCWQTTALKSKQDS
ncbi:MAG: transposase [Rhizonema sp. NSF051]|nr:transposase [Rhizonema sp. NSF051]